MKVREIESEYEIVERWRLDRVFADIRKLTTALLHTAPKEWQSALLKIACAETFAEVEGCRNVLINTITTNSYTNDRIPCPLCSDTPQQDGRGFSIPTGLERHLRGYGQSDGCVVLWAVTNEARMSANEHDNRRFYMSQH